MEQILLHSSIYKCTLNARQMLLTRHHGDLETNQMHTADWIIAAVPLLRDLRKKERERGDYVHGRVSKRTANTPYYIFTKNIWNEMLTTFLTGQLITSIYLPLNVWFITIIRPTDSCVWHIQAHIKNTIKKWWKEGFWGLWNENRTFPNANLQI